MSWLMVMGLTLAGLSALAMSMQRHAAQMFAKSPRPAVRTASRLAGSLLLAYAVIFAMIAFGAGYGFIVFLAAATVAGSGTILTLTYRPAALPWLAGVSLFLALVALMT